jgi:hypothetical protein
MRLFFGHDKRVVHSLASRKIFLTA